MTGATWWSFPYREVGSLQVGSMEKLADWTQYTITEAFEGKRYVGFHTHFIGTAM